VPAGSVQIEQEPTPTTSGKLEVTVAGRLVHSKANGMGYVDSVTKMAAIVDVVVAEIAKQQQLKEDDE